MKASKHEFENPKSWIFSWTLNVDRSGHRWVVERFLRNLASTKWGGVDENMGGLKIRNGSAKTRISPAWISEVVGFEISEMVRQIQEYRCFRSPTPTSKWPGRNENMDDLDLHETGV